MTRTFIALELNTDLQSHLVEITRQMASALPGIRWVNPESIHLTLAFLGELDDAALTDAREAALVAAQQCKVFRYRLSQPGIFGTVRHPRVIWIGIDEPTGRLQRLHRLLNRELARRDFPTEQRPFSPHLTLARVKAPLSPLEQQRLEEILAGKRILKYPHSNYQMNHLAVMKSELNRSGAIYTCLQNCPLSDSLDSPTSM